MRRPALLVAVLTAFWGGCRDRPAPPPAATAPLGAPPAVVGSGTPPARSAEPAAGGGTRPRLPESPNLLLITIDALRADMPWTGYPRPIAPRLTRLAAESVVYSHAYALSSYTSMSLAGLMTGRYPAELPRNGLATSTFFEEGLFLAEVLRDAGLRTIGVHGHVYFLGATGIAQGFDDWQVFPRITLFKAREGAVTDDQLATMTIDALRRHDAEHGRKRFFAWVHFMDPHFDYARHEGFPRFRAAKGEIVPAVPPGVPLSPVGQALRDRYDGEVAFTDHQVGRLLDFVESQPWGARTIVVVTADHGEAFGEHRSYFEHGHLLYDVTTRVPLLVRVPGVPPRRIDERRSHVDLARTFLELMGLPAAPAMRGVSLVAELLGREEPRPRDVVMDLPYTDQSPRRRALIRDDLKVIVTESDPPLLFDLAADPGEQRDLAASDPQRLEAMLDAVRKLDETVPDYEAPRRRRSY